MSHSMATFWSDDWPGTQARDPPETLFPLQHVAPAAPFVRCTPEQWQKVVLALYAAIRLTPPSVLPPQRLSLTEVAAVIWRAKALYKQIPPKGAISFRPVCPLVWKPGLCDLCGGLLYRSAYGWPNRWRCDACILAIHLALGFLTPEQWLTGSVVDRDGATSDCVEGRMRDTG